jgi:hypothetical protein
VRSICCIIIGAVALGGCAVSTRPQGLGYGDYLGYSCNQLGEEAVRLMRQAGSRSEHIIESDRDMRDDAMRQLKAVKQASLDKKC